MGITLIITALGMGFITGFHCLGMCGPIAISLGLSAENKFKFYSQNLIYQLGRIVTYVFLGFLIGIIGEGVNLSGYQGSISIIIGIILIVFVLLPQFTHRFTGRIVVLDKLMIKLKIFLGNYLQKKSFASRFTTGILNGFLPCGAVYVALTASIAYGGIVESMYFMLFFGLGTVPFMFLAVLLGNVIGAGLREKLNRVYPYLIVVFGLLFILRGLELGIPYLSPNEASLQIEAKKDCCH